LVGSDHRAIDTMDVPMQLAMGIGLGLHRRQELAPAVRATEST
jgi:hypothetical protein